MPFHGVLPEREALFQPQPTRDVGVNDVQAWRLNPRHRHVYNKLDIALSQGLSAAPCGVAPEQLGVSADAPVFVKPVINLAGMSLGARIEAAGQVRAEAGSFWCELLEGQQTSTDCLLQDGKVVWCAHTLAAEERNKQRPVYWQVGVQLPDVEAPVQRFLEARLEGYTGLCNVEVIAGKVIEVHLRGSNGFFDFYGSEFVRSWVTLVDRNQWQSPGPIQQGIVYSVFSDSHVTLDAERLQSIARSYPGVTIQPDPHAADRVAILRGTCLDDARRLAEQITK
jgi:hypothetical protein